MLAEHQLPNHNAITVAARFLLTSLFLLSGVTHFTNIPYYVDLMPDATPYPVFWVIISGVVELAGALMILFNWRPRLGAWMLVVFLIPVTIVVHGYEMIHAEGEAMRANQQASYIKGISQISAAQLLTQKGCGHRDRPAAPTG